MAFWEWLKTYESIGVGDGYFTAADMFNSWEAATEEAKRLEDIKIAFNSLKGKES